MEVLVLGPTVVRVGDQEVQVDRLMERALLVRLASAQGAVVSDAVIAADLWADDELERHCRRLRVVVCRLRAALGGQARLLTRTPAGYRLAAGIPDLRLARSGANRVRAAVRKADHVAVRAEARAVLDLWRGPALSDLRSMAHGLAEAERLDELHLELTVARLRAEIELGAGGDLVTELGGLAMQHPLHEPIHSLLALALYRSARQAEALDQLARLRWTLLDELGVDPAPDTVDLELRLLRQDPALLPRELVPPPLQTMPAPAAPRYGLAASSSSFVGRDGDLAELLDALAGPGVVTLLGAPGVGKSRLAAEASRAVAASGRAVVVVELARTCRSDEVADAVAQAAGVGGGVSASARVLDGALLVLDDAEHVVEEVGALVAVLCRAAPGLTVLVASQRPLLVADEVRHRVRPLDPKAAETLFLQLAAADAIAPHGRDEQDIAMICSAVDRLPRGIELAAGLTRTLTVAQLAQRVPDGLRLLVGGRRDGGGRHRSLRAALDRSFGLLGELEQAVLRRVSVIPGPFTLETAEQVVADEEVELGDVAPALAELVDRSLITVRNDRGARRYVLLGTIRQYAFAQLDGVGETAALRRSMRRIAAAEPIRAGDLAAAGVSSLTARRPRPRAICGESAAG